MSGMNVNPSGSSTTPGDDATYVPDPCLIVTMLREASNFMASRRELLPILSSLARCASLGSLPPGCKCSFIGTASTLCGQMTDDVIRLREEIAGKLATWL